MTNDKQPSTSQSASDPHADREATNYENPIPSREFILEFLDKAGKALTHPQIANDLNLSSADNFEALRRRLIAMTRDGQLVCNRRNQFFPKAKSKTVVGTVIGHRDGFGFVKGDEEGDDIFLSARQMQSVFDGDKVEVRLDSADHRGNVNGIVEKVLEHNTDQFVGRLFI